MWFKFYCNPFLHASTAPAIEVTILLPCLQAPALTLTHDLKGATHMPLFWRPTWSDGEIDTRIAHPILNQRPPSYIGETMGFAVDLRRLDLVPRPIPHCSVFGHLRRGPVGDATPLARCNGGVSMVIADVLCTQASDKTAPSVTAGPRDLAPSDLGDVEAEPTWADALWITSLRPCW